jgi:hypothetical protein
MSAKDKGKTDETASVTSNNKKERKILTPTTTTTVVELKKDTFIKVKESAVFTENRTKFTAYKTSMGLAV